MFTYFFNKIKYNYSTREHILFWLGIFLNFYSLYHAISALEYLGIIMPIIHGIYLAVCLVSYIKGARALYIIIPLFIIALVFYLATNINII